MERKRREILDSGMGTVGKIYWLLEYCKRYGTLPFAGLARAGFIAVELLNSMVSSEIMKEEERVLYMNGLPTVGKNISRDLAELSTSEFLKRYGHLCPGTYDICSRRYDQGKNMYFNFSQSPNSSEKDAPPFKLSLQQYEALQKMLEDHQLETDVLSLFSFIRCAIEGQEYAKFVFTRTLSDTLELLAQLGKSFGLSREDMSHASIQRVMEAYSSAEDLEVVLRASICEGKRLEQKAVGITLPPLLWEEKQVYSFFMPDNSPNFITQNRCSAETVLLPSDASLEGKLVLIREADPSYDWIFLTISLVL